MEVFAEQVIEAFLMQGGKVFISAGYNINSGRSCPDFVALDFSKQEVIVIEVTTAYDVATPIERVKNREQQWFNPLRAQLDADHIAEGWEMRFLGFVRRDRQKKQETLFGVCRRLPLVDRG
jgi:hypothetical protein